MEPYHRQMIERNISSLIEQANLKLVCESLHRKGVFSDRMIVPFKNESVPEWERLKEMFLYLKTRGPNAFASLIQTLNETRHYNLAKLLDPYNNPANQHLDVVDDPTPRRTHPTTLPQYMRNAEPNIGARVCEIGMNFPEAEINLSTTPDTIKVKLATDWMDCNSRPNLHVYPMGSHPKGLFLLINNVEYINGIYDQRDGAEVDERNMLSLFEQLGYNNVSYRNQDREAMLQTVREFANIASSDEACSVVVCVMSHGKEGLKGTDIVTQDGTLLSIEEILEEFTGEKCPGMHNKPKIFIFQTCRGNRENRAVRSTTRRIGTTTHDGAPSILMRNTGHMFVAHSTLPGYISMRDTMQGTWFIQKVCQVFMDNAWNTSLEDMFIMVNSLMSPLTTEHNLVQTSCYENRGFNKFFFNPGLFDTTPTALEPLPMTTQTKPLPMSQESIPDVELDSSSSEQSL